MNSLRILICLALRHCLCLICYCVQDFGSILFGSAHIYNTIIGLETALVQYFPFRSQHYCSLMLLLRHSLLGSISYLPVFILQKWFQEVSVGGIVFPFSFSRNTYFTLTAEPQHSSEQNSRLAVIFIQSFEDLVLLLLVSVLLLRSLLAVIPLQVLFLSLLLFLIFYSLTLVNYSLSTRHLQVGFYLPCLELVLPEFLFYISSQPLSL